MKLKALAILAIASLLSLSCYAHSHYNVTGVDVVTLSPTISSSARTSSANISKFHDLAQWWKENGSSVFITTQSWLSSRRVEGLAANSAYSLYADPLTEEILAVKTHGSFPYETADYRNRTFYRLAGSAVISINAFYGLTLDKSTAEDFGLLTNEGKVTPRFAAFLSAIPRGNSFLFKKKP